MKWLLRGEGYWLWVVDGNFKVDDVLFTTLFKVTIPSPSVLGSIQSKQEK